MGRKCSPARDLMFPIQSWIGTARSGPFRPTAARSLWLCIVPGSRHNDFAPPHRVFIMPSSTVEDYLKSILHLEEQGRSHAEFDGITVGAIAGELRLTPGTVSTMMRHLEEKGWIDYRPRHSVALRPEGRRQALNVVRRHRLI